MLDTRLMADSNDKIALGKPTGVTGTVILNGMISSEEYNADLQGHRGNAVYDQMRRSDPTVGAALDALKLPLLGAEWTIQAAGDEPLNQEIAEAVRVTLFERLDWQSLLFELLTSLEFGFWAGEKEYVYDLVNGKKIITLKSIETRKQKTIYYWNTQDHQPGITQITYAGTFSIARPRLVLFTYHKEGDNFEGTSVLRRAYKSWYMKTQIEKIEAISIERQGLGVIYIKEPDQPDATQLAAAKEAARSLRANEEAYVSIPSNWEIGFMDMKADKLVDPSNAIDRHDRGILLNVLAQFLMIGSKGSSGSYAASADHSRMFELCLANVAQQIATVINRDVIKQMVDLNWSVTEYPTLQAGNISENNIEVLATAIQQLVASNVLTPEVEVERSVRKVLHLPEMSDDLEENYDDRAKVGAAAPAPAVPGEPVVPPAVPAPKADPKGTDPTEEPAVKAERLLLLAQQTREALIAGVEVLYANAD